ncbi:MAG: alkaline phosphatase family protein, partial [Lachnospiraceae bacterium]|nr:alkaline phosphatase family protein [Lachnospiraceae bacterium]
KKFGLLRDGVHQPALDNFVHASALHTIAKYNPEMVLIHFTDVDTNRHIYGLDHEKVTEAMERHDKRLGELMDMLEATGGMDKTTVVILGDHCQFDTERVVYLNFLLKQEGFLEADGDKITDYIYISKNCDGCTYIYENPKRRATKEEFEKLTNLLEKCKGDPIYGIDRIFTGKEAGELGADDTCVFLVEAKAPVFYLDYCHTLTEPVSEMKKGKMRGTHGYLPDKPGYETFFMAFGYGIQEGVEVPSMNLYDEGPTLAKIIDVMLSEADGRCIDEILSIT